MIAWMKDPRMRWIPIMGIITMSLGVVLGIFTNIWFGIALIVGIFGGFVLQGLRNIPNDPPHKGVVTHRGERIEEGGETVTVDEGWHFFPFYPFLYGYVLVDVSRKTFIVSTKVKTPDRADSEVPVHLVFRPLEGHLIQYLDSGGREGAEEQFSGKVEERVREWAIDPDWGPYTWVELQQSQLEGTSILLRSMVPKEPWDGSGDHPPQDKIVEVPDYAQKVPTSIWMAYFQRPDAITARVKGEELWMKDNWAKVEKELAKMSDDEKVLLRNIINHRRKQVEDIRAGSGKFLIDDLGIQLERLNIGDVKVLGEVALAAEKQAKEDEDRQGEELELKHVRDQVVELSETLGGNASAAMEAVQIERGKVPKEIKEVQITLSPDAKGVLESVAGIFGAALGKGGDK